MADTYTKTDGTVVRRIDLVDVAKLIRKTLKAEFPGIKFSVRSERYSMGASIDVRWTDGPSERAVRAFTDLYEGADFDGMIDLKSYKDSILTTEDGAEVVKFGVDFVVPQREISDEAATATRAEVEAYVENLEPVYGKGENAAYAVKAYGPPTRANECGELGPASTGPPYTVSELAYQLAYQRDLTREECT
jgi:hypothetical protein